MILLPLHTTLLQPGDDLAEVLWNSAMLSSRLPVRSSEGAKAGVENRGAIFVPRDIIVLSSKALATVEGAFIDLDKAATEPDEFFEAPSHRRRENFLKRNMEGRAEEAVGAKKILPSSMRGKEILKLSERIHRSPAFCAAMLRELERLNGTIIGTVPGAALTEVRPEGMQGSILVANAGLDESNAPEGMAVGWPRDPVASVGRLRKELEERIGAPRGPRAPTAPRKSMKESSVPLVPSVPSVPSLGIILSDSICTPRRSGVTAIALVASGLNPLQSQKGKEDLFGKPLKITTEAIADQLATATNFVMGNAAQSVPAVLIRDHGLMLSE